MPVSKSQQNATKKYNAKSYIEITIKPKIEEGERIRAHAKKNDESMTRFLVRAAETQMGIDEEKAKAGADKSSENGKGEK